MTKLFPLACIALAACLSAADAPTPADDGPELSAYNWSYYSLGWARVTSGGGLGDHSSAPGGVVQPINVFYAGTGTYYVTFNGLGAASVIGQWQVTAEGTNSNSCHIQSVSTGSTNPQAQVMCAAQSTGALADTPFAIMYYRYNAPAANTWPLNAAYTFVNAGGTVNALGDYNSRGAANTVTHSSMGTYLVHLTGGTTAASNASVLVTALGGALGTTCNVVGWSGVQVNVQCHTRAGALIDNNFFLSFAYPVPTLDQQGAHAYFNGTGLSTGYFAGNGKILTCSTVNISGSLSGTAALLTVAGDLGSWDATPFVRASFAGTNVDPGYCKVESVTSTGVAPTSSSTTTVRCYTPAGAVITTPHVLWSHVTSDRGGPC